jgi:hypothetical protein
MCQLAQLIRRQQIPSPALRALRSQEPLRMARPAAHADVGPPFRRIQRLGVAEIKLPSLMAQPRSDQQVQRAQSPGQDCQEPLIAVGKQRQARRRGEIGATFRQAPSTRSASDQRNKGAIHSYPRLGNTSSTRNPAAAELDRYAPQVVHIAAASLPLRLSVP